MTEIERYAIKSGYVRSPNNQYEFYPGGPGLPTMPAMIVTITDKVWLSVRRYATEEIVPVMAFDAWGDLWGYMLLNGSRSKPGLSAYSNSWD